MTTRRTRRRTKTGTPEGGAAPEIDLDMLDTIIGYSLRRAQFHVYQDYARTIGALEVRPAQFAAMTILGSNPGLSQTQLSNIMGIDRSGAVVLIDALEDRGLAMRVPSPTDRRSYSIVLTAQGQALLVKLKELVAEHDARMTAGMTVEERQALVSLLRRIYERSEQ